MRPSLVMAQRGHVDIDGGDEALKASLDDCSSHRLPPSPGQ
jgi:hypothetical protein